MAKTGSITIAQGTQDIVNNKTPITVNGIIKTSGESYRGNSRTGTITVTQDGAVIHSNTFTHGAPANSTTTLFSISLTVSHKTDGSSGTIVASYNYDSGWCSASTSTTLTTIPRASEPSCITWPTTTYDVGYIGDTIAIHMNRKSNFTHTVKYVWEKQSGTIGTGVENNISWTIPTEFMNEIPNNTSGIGTITVDTYSGSTLIGSKSVSFKTNVPTDIIPTVKGTLLDVAEHFDKYGKYIQGQSKLQVSINAEGIYGSTIKSYKTTFDGKTFTEAEFTTDVIIGKGTLELEIVVTDSRGRICPIKESIEVYEYNPPKITSIKAKRCQQHNVNLAGEKYLGVLFSSAVTSLDGQNSSKYELEYKKTTDDTYTTLPPLNDYANQYLVEGNAIFEADNDAYNIILRITDDFGSVEKKINGPSVSVLVSKLKYNLGIAFGKLAELSGVLDIGFKTRFFGGILHVVLDDGTKADEILTPNRYLVKAKHAYEGFPEIEVDATLDVVGDDEIIKQTFSVISKTQPRTYERVYTYSDETWSDWICLCGDFVIEQGTSGIWSYTKWNSGKCELYGYNASAIAIDIQQNYVYRSAPVTVNLPFTVYGMVAHIDCSDVNAWGSTNTYQSDSGNTAISYVIWRGGSYASYTWGAYIHILGRWK